MAATPVPAKVGWGVFALSVMLHLVAIGMFQDIKRGVALQPPSMKPTNPQTSARATARRTLAESDIHTSRRELSQSQTRAQRERFARQLTELVQLVERRQLATAPTSMQDPPLSFPKDWASKFLKNLMHNFLQFKSPDTLYSYLFQALVFNVLTIKDLELALQQSPRAELLCTTDPVKLWPIMSIDEFGDWQPGRTFDRCKIDWNRVQDGQDPDTNMHFASYTGVLRYMRDAVQTQDTNEELARVRQDTALALRLARTDFTFDGKLVSNTVLDPNSNAVYNTATAVGNFTLAEVSALKNITRLLQFDKNGIIIIRSLKTWQLQASNLYVTEVAQFGVNNTGKSDSAGSVLQVFGDIHVGDDIGNAANGTAWTPTYYTKLSPGKAFVMGPYTPPGAKTPAKLGAQLGRDKSQSSSVLMLNVAGGANLGSGKNDNVAIPGTGYAFRLLVLNKTLFGSMNADSADKAGKVLHIYGDTFVGKFINTTAGSPIVYATKIHPGKVSASQPYTPPGSKTAVIAKASLGRKLSDGFASTDQLSVDLTSSLGVASKGKSDTAGKVVGVYGEVWVGNDVVANGPPIYLTKVHPGKVSASQPFFAPGAKAASVGKASLGFKANDVVAGKAQPDHLSVQGNSTLGLPNTLVVVGGTLKGKVSA